MTNEVIIILIVETVSIIGILIAGAFYIGKRDKTISNLAERMDGHESHCNERNKNIHAKLDHNAKQVADVSGDIRVLNERGIAMKESIDFLKKQAESRT